MPPRTDPPAGAKRNQRPVALFRRAKAAVALPGLATANAAPVQAAVPAPGSGSPPGWPWLTPAGPGRAALRRAAGVNRHFGLAGRGSSHFPKSKSTPTAFPSVPSVTCNTRPSTRRPVTASWYGPNASVPASDRE